MSTSTALTHQEVNSVAGDEYDDIGDELKATNKWTVNSGPNGGIVTVTVSWNPGSGSTTSTFVVPANKTGWPIEISSSNTVPDPIPNIMTCNFSLSAGGPAMVTPANFYKAGGGGGFGL